ncbi:MAG: hypothetical protein PUC65_04115, partial [Clostridiales bacterium]|nr:hypothetical protein [Clostridiales bacterium]
MKQFKQLAALFLAFALVIGLFSVPTVAYAEEKLEETTLSESNVTVDYVTEEIVVTKDAKDSIYYTTKYAEKNHAKTEWDTAYVVAATGAAIDFSNTAANKKITYYLTNDITKKPIEVNINPQETTLVVDFSGVAKTTVKSKVKVEADWTGINALTAGYTKFNPTNSNPWTYGFLCASIKDADKKAVALTKDQVQKYLQFKKGSAGAWKSVTELDVRKYAANGAQLYFRIAPTNDEVASGSALRLGRASKEVKVTYKKQAKAPKLTIKGDTKQVSLTKTMEYRVGTATGGATVFGSWIKVADHHMNGTKVKTTYLKDLLTASGAPWNYDESEAGQVIQVRTAATDKAVASKINTVKLNAVET